MIRITQPLRLQVVIGAPGRVTYKLNFKPTIITKNILFLTFSRRSKGNFRLRLRADWFMATCGYLLILMYSQTPTIRLLLLFWPCDWQFGAQFLESYETDIY